MVNYNGAKLQDLSGRAGGRRIRKGRILLARRTRRNGPGDRLRRGAADAFAGDRPTTRSTGRSGTYMTNAEVEKAFGVSDLPKPWSVAPNQPFTGQFYYTWGAAAAAAAVRRRDFYDPVQRHDQHGSDRSRSLCRRWQTRPTPQTVFSQPFELKGNRNVRITASAPVNNSWADLDVDLVNDQSQEVESVNIPIEYYQRHRTATERGPKAARRQDATLSSLPAGKYTLRVEGTWQNWQQPMPVTVKVEQNVNRGVNFCCAFLMLADRADPRLVQKVHVRIEPLEGQYVRHEFVGRSMNDATIVRAKLC